MKTLQTDTKIIELLDMKELSRVIAHTDKGILTLQLRKGENTYHLVLDAVPVEKALNKELMDLIFPAKTQTLDDKRFPIDAPQEVKKESAYNKIEDDFRPKMRDNNTRKEFTGFNPLVTETTQKVLDKATIDVLAPRS